jgi:large subunit ribosomal protein L4
MAEDKVVAKTTKVKKTVNTEETKNEAKMPVYSLEGKETGSLPLPTELFGIEINKRLVAQYVRVYMANQRQGTASTKSRGEVIGSTIKIFRQKGTGKARHGSIKAPIFVGGGVSSGPKPTDHSLKMNKKQKRKALLTVLSMKAEEKSLAALAKDVVSMEPKTKTLATLFHVINPTDKRMTLVCTNVQNDGLKLSARNLKYVTLMSASSLNAYELLNSTKVLFTEEALQVVTKQYTTE